MRTSPAVHWLRIRLTMQGTWVSPLVGELRSHMMPQSNQALTAPLERVQAPQRTVRKDARTNPHAAATNPRAATKARRGQISKQINKYLKTF